MAQSYFHLNSAVAKVASARSTGTTSLVVDDATPFSGATFPVRLSVVRFTEGGNPFGDLVAIFRATGLTGTTFTLDGVLEGTVDASCEVDDYVFVGPTAADFTDLWTNVTSTSDSLATLETEVDTLTTTVAGKADASDLSTLQTEVDTLTTTVAGKADSTTVSTLQGEVDTLATSVTTKADASDLSTLQGEVDTLSTTVDGKADASDIPQIGNPLTGGTAGRVLYLDSSANLAQSANLTYSSTNGLSCGDSSQATERIGYNANTGVGASSNQCTAIGYAARAGGDAADQTYRARSTVIGANSQSYHGSSVVIGASAYAGGTESIVIGYNTNATTGYALVIGSSNALSNNAAMVLGRGNTATYEGSTAIGNGCNTKKKAEIVLGCRSYADQCPSIRVIGTLPAAAWQQADVYRLDGFYSADSVDYNNYRSGVSIEVYKGQPYVAQSGIKIEATTGTQAKLGFFGSAAAAKPTVTGSRSDGTALASLLTALASLGLITDSTTS